MEPKSAGNNHYYVFTLQTKAAVVVLPTPGGPESNAALKPVPSSLLPVLLGFAGGREKKKIRFYLSM